MDYAGVILEGENNTLLLQLRDNNKKTKNPNTWSIFGGGIKKKELPIKAAIREIKEELNFTLKLKDLKLFIKENLNNQMYYIFRAKLIDLSILSLAEGKDMHLFSKEELSKLNNVPLLMRKYEGKYWKEREENPL